MSLNYYLLCREKYEYMLKYLEDIHDYIFQLTNDSRNLLEENYCKLFFIEFNINSLNTTKENIVKLKDICNEIIAKLCIHDFVDDLIDITPDRSQHITYCKICGYTK